jgi:peptidoglycan/LPS O-acetylase OafA/YrhL
LQTAPAGNRFAGLDHLRALAIIIVFVFHYSMWGNPPGLHEGLGSWGWTGVDLFFVLSGFLIGGQLFAKLSRNQPISYGDFYLKRSLRILPAYLATLLLYLTIPAFTERSHLPPLWRMLTFTQNFGLDLSQHGAFSHAWSLCIEEQFYLFLPLLIIGLTTLKAGKKAVWIIPALFLLGFAVRSYIWFNILATPEQTSYGKNYYKLIYYPTWSRLDGLLAGVALAAFYYFKPAAWQRLTRKGNLLLLIALLLLAGAWFIAHGDHQYEMRGAIFGYPAIAIGYGALVLAALSPTSFLSRSGRTESGPRHYVSRLTRLIATLSYAIYLTHKQLIHLTHEALRPLGIGDNTYTCFWISVAVSLLGGWLLHVIIEKPFLRLRDRLLSKRPPQENKFASALNSR